MLHVLVLLDDFADIQQYVLFTLLTGIDIDNVVPGEVDALQSFILVEDWQKLLEMLGDKLIPTYV